MTRTKKPPTLAALRKLAKSKGFGFVKTYKLPPEDGDKRIFFYATTSKLWGSTTVDITSGRRAEVAEVLRSVFSAFPDADKKATRHAK